MSKIGVAAALVLVATTSLASAYDRIDRRQERQEHRIQQGLSNGSLTRYEYRKLENEQAYIRGLERRAKSDGYVNSYERAQIRAAQNAARAHISAETHDSQTRGSRSYRNRWSRWNQ